MHKKTAWFFPILSIVMFLTLVGAMVLEIGILPFKPMMSFSLGLLAFVLMLVLTIIAVRPKKIEHQIGLPLMYAIHAWLGIVSLVSMAVHVLLQFNGFYAMFRISEMSTISQLGFIGILMLIITFVTGIFMLSNTFIAKSKTLMRWKDQKFKREIGLWLHRTAIIAIIAIYLHIINLSFAAPSTLFFWLLTLYTVGTLVAYAVSKIQVLRLPKYKVSQVNQLTPDLYEFEFTPKDGEVMDYKAGQYVFVRMVDSEMAGEAHPFSISSAPIKGNNHLQVIIKNSGDYTAQLDKIKVGDTATLEGPYGAFYPDDVKQDNNPIVLMAGGIGLTPSLSILRELVSQNTDREVFLVLALAYEQDVIYKDMFDRLSGEFENFSYHIIFSNEEVEGYAHGFISEQFLDDIQVSDRYQTADFFICGPSPMMTATENILKDNNVNRNNIHIEEFAF